MPRNSDRTLGLLVLNYMFLVAHSSFHYFYVQEAFKGLGSPEMKDSRSPLS